MKAEAKLTRPEIFDDFWWPSLSHKQSQQIVRAAELAAKELDYQPNIAAIIRTKNDREGLAAWVKHIEAERKTYKSRIDIVVVDTESTDGTLEIAKKAKATIVPIKQSEFNYPKSMNIGFEVVKPDVEAAFITVGHALPAVNIAMQAGARHFKDPEVVAVYADQIVHANASNTEKLLFYTAPNLYYRMKKGPFVTSRTHGGLTGGTGCMVRMSTWRLHPFDEAYAHGGEDLAWGRWALKNKLKLVYDPVVVVHHSHGLSFINFLRQLKYWGYVAIRKGEFKTEKIARYRPDLFK